MSGSDVAVVGGGVIGLACAWRLAQRGASVTIFDPAPGAGASHAAAGMLAPVTEGGSVDHYVQFEIINRVRSDSWRW